MSLRTQPSPVDLQITGQQPHDECATARLALDPVRRGARASGRRCSTGASSWCSSRVAWLLGRWAKSPLRFVEWLLLGLGLSTQSWFVFSLTAAWLMTMRWREHWQPAATICALAFQRVQVVLAAVHLRHHPHAGVLGHSQWTAGAARYAHRRNRWPLRRLQLVPGPDRRSHRRPEHLLGADVGVSRAVLRVGDAGWRSRWWAGCAGRSTRGRRTACGAARNGDGAGPGNAGRLCEVRARPGSVEANPGTSQECRHRLHYSTRPSR